MEALATPSLVKSNDLAHAAVVGVRRASNSIGDIMPSAEWRRWRLWNTSEGSIAMPEGECDIEAIFSGKGPQHEPDEENLSEIINALDERFGTDLDERDQLLFDQFEETWATNPEVVDQARNNDDFKNFSLVFEKLFLSTILGRTDDNEEIVKRILDDEEYRGVLREIYSGRLYRRLREVG